MQLLIDVRKVVGTAKGGVWSQVDESRQDGEQTLILMRVSYLGDSDVLEIGTVGAETLESLKAKLGVRGKELEGLRQVVGELNEEVGEEIEIEVVVARVRGSRLLVAGVLGEVYLRRDNKLGKIYEGSQIVSGVEGELKAEDVLVLTTNELVRAIGVEKLRGAFEQGGEEELAVRVHGQEDSSAMASLLVRVSEKREQELGQKGLRKAKERIDGRKLLARIKGITRQPVMISKKKRKFNNSVAIGLIILLMVGILVGVVRRSQVVKETRYTKLVEIVESKLSEARDVADLNPERARLILNEARGEIESYLSEIEEGDYKDKAQLIEQRIGEVESEVFRKEETEVKTLVELSVIEGGVNAAEMIQEGEGNVWFLSLDGERAVGLNVGDKSSWEVALGGGVREMAIKDKEIYLVSNGGVERMSSEGGEREKIIEEDELWGEIGGVETFANNIYLLDTGEGEIWKYPALTEGFGARRRWLGVGISLDLSNVIDWQVDGDIWLLTSTGKLERYSRGVPVTFSMEGFPAVEGNKLSDPGGMYVSEDKVYVIERGAKRVVVFDLESGRYEKQLVNEVFSQGREIVVVEGRGYVWTGEKLVWFEV